MSMRLLAMINECFSLELQLADLVEHNSIKRLASLVDNEISETGGAFEQSGTGRFQKTFCEEAAWFSKRLGAFPDGLHFKSLDGESNGTLELFPDLSPDLSPTGRQRTW